MSGAAGENAAILQEARSIVVRTLESSTPEERGDWGVMQEKSVRTSSVFSASRRSAGGLTSHAGDFGNVI